MGHKALRNCSNWRKQGSQVIWKEKGRFAQYWRRISSVLMKPRCSCSSTRTMPCFSIERFQTLPVRFCKKVAAALGAKGWLLRCPPLPRSSLVSDSRSMLVLLIGQPLLLESALRLGHLI